MQKPHANTYMRAHACARASMQYTRLYLHALTQRRLHIRHVLRKVLCRCSRKTQVRRGHPETSAGRRECSAEGCGVHAHAACFHPRAAPPDSRHTRAPARRYGTAAAAHLPSPPLPCPPPCAWQAAWPGRGWPCAAGRRPWPLCSPAAPPPCDRWPCSSEGGGVGWRRARGWGPLAETSGGLHARGRAATPAWATTGARMASTTRTETRRHVRAESAPLVHALHARQPPHSPHAAPCRAVVCCGMTPSTHLNWMKPMDALSSSHSRFTHSSVSCRAASCACTSSSLRSSTQHERAGRWQAGGGRQAGAALLATRVQCPQRPAGSGVTPEGEVPAETGSDGARQQTTPVTCLFSNALICLRCASHCADSLAFLSTSRSRRGMAAMVVVLLRVARRAQRWAGEVDGGRAAAAAAAAEAGGDTTQPGGRCNFMYDLRGLLSCTGEASGCTMANKSL